MRGRVWGVGGGGGVGGRSHLGLAVERWSEEAREHRAAVGEALRGLLSQETPHDGTERVERRVDVERLKLGGGGGGAGEVLGGG